MKTNEYVYCIKSFDSFIKGKKYYVESLKSLVLSSSSWFCCVAGENEIYFKTEKQMRQLKLQRIINF